MHKILFAVSALGLTGLANSASADAAEPSVEIIYINQLPIEKIALTCDPRELQQRIDEKQKSSASSEYQAMLSYAQRHEGDGYSQIMENKSLHARLSAGGEAALFISQDFSRAAVVKFKAPASVNSFLKGGAACTKDAGNICMPALFFDGAKMQCLLFTTKELGG